MVLWSDAGPFLWVWYSFFPVLVQDTQMQQRGLLVAIQSAGYINQLFTGQNL